MDGSIADVRAAWEAGIITHCQTCGARWERHGWCDGCGRPVADGHDEQQTHQIGRLTLCTSCALARMTELVRAA